MAPPFVLFVLFALLATGGVYWIAHAEKGWRVATLAALVTFLFFVALAAGLLWFIRQGLGP